MPTQRAKFKPLSPVAGVMAGLGEFGQLVTKLADGSILNLLQPACQATITVAAEITDVRQITITLKDRRGVAINYAQMVEIIVFSSAAGTDFVATGGSTGIAIGASGKLLTVVAKKVFKAISTTAGVIALTWTDTGTETFAIGVKLPNGRVVMSTAQANA